MTRRWSRLPLVGRSARMQLADRLTGRFWDYPRWLAPRVRDFDVFHIVDHSYAHLDAGAAGRAHGRDLPRSSMRLRRRCCRWQTGRDDFARCLSEPLSTPFHPEGLLARSVLDGVSRAAHVACISEATRTSSAGQRTRRTGTCQCHLSRRASELHAGIERMRSGRADLLHVGSTIPRKRIDVLLEVFAGASDEPFPGFGWFVSEGR